MSAEWTEQISKWYPGYAHLLDEDFMQKVQKNDSMISSRYTEILTAKILMEHNSNFKLSSPGKKNKAAPDFVLKSKNNIFVECVTPQNSCQSEQNRISLKPDNQANQPDIRKVQLMISNALSEKIIDKPQKVSRYNAYLRDGIMTEDDPLILVIGLYGIPWIEVMSYFVALASNPIPWQVIGTFLPTGHPTMRINAVTSGSIDERLFLGVKENNQKDNGTEISKNIFGDPRFSCVSAVIISGKNWTENFLNDFIMLHNNNAKNKIPYNTINAREEYALINNQIVSVKKYK